MRRPPVRISIADLAPLSAAAHRLQPREQARREEEGCKRARRQIAQRLLCVWPRGAGTRGSAWAIVLGKRGRLARLRAHCWPHWPRWRQLAGGKFLSKFKRWRRRDRRPKLGSSGRLSARVAAALPALGAKISAIYLSAAQIHRPSISGGDGGAVRLAFGGATTI